MLFAARPPIDFSTLLERHRVFGLLPVSTRYRLAQSLTETTARSGERIAGGDRFRDHLFWLIEGEVGLHDADGVERLSLRDGDLFGRTLGEPLQVISALALSDCRYTRMDALTADSLLREEPALGYFLPLDRDAFRTAPQRTPGTRPGNDPALNLLTTPVRSLLKREPVTLPPHTPIREAAQVMCEQRVSSVLIVEQGLLFGLITDRDLRNRVIAAGMDTERPIADIATLAPMSIDVKHPAFDALSMMARHNIHHVPVLDGQHIAGMITATDLTEQQSTSAVYLASEIYRQTSVEGLQASAAKIQRLQRSLASAEASAYSTGHIVTAITDAITTRLLQLGEARLGPPPIDYVWVAAGSQARNEQTARSDQDNGMVLDDRFDEATHGDYFKALSRFVCDGLNACGYVYCPGEMMAVTDLWRQPRRTWSDYFERWTQQPDPTALMLTCVFFDLRAIHGQTELLEDLRREVLRRTRGNTLFLAHMVGIALQHPPPLGMFKGITPIRSGENKGKIDLKHSGVVPIVDLARVYALANGDSAVNTHDRLLGAAAGGAISEQSAHDLRDALEFLASLRIRHQSRQIAASETPDNFLGLNELSNFERTQLKDAFVVVQSLQSVLGQRYKM